MTSRTPQSLPTSSGQDELSTIIRDCLRAIGQSEPFDFDKNVSAYTKYILSAIAQHTKEAERRVRIDELERWFDPPKHYPGEEYRDDPFWTLRYKTPSEVRYIAQDSKFGWAIRQRLAELAAPQQSKERSA